MPSCLHNRSNTCVPLGSFFLPPAVKRSVNRLQLSVSSLMILTGGPAEPSSGNRHCCHRSGRHTTRQRPARGAVDGNEQVAPCCLVGHLRQVLDVDLERLTKSSGQGAASKTVRLYGETLQRSHGGFVRRSWTDM